MSKLQKNLALATERRLSKRANRSKTLQTIVEISEDRAKRAQDTAIAGSTAPNFQSAATRKLGGHHQGDGHNHPVGSIPTEQEAEELWQRVQRLVKDRPSIKPGARTRDYATQVRLWNNYKAGKGPQAARPGTSKHGSGRANDLQYSNEADRQWALQNAGKYGLHFPIYNPKLSRSRDESWHVELKR